MKNYNIAFLISAVIFTACGTPAPTNNNVGNAANQAQNQTVTNTNSTTALPANSTAPSALSPIETMKALNEAAKNKDSAAMKNFVSKGTLAIMEENAKEQKMTVDELLKSDESNPFEDLPEMRNEKIEGERATVEVRNESEEDWVTLPFTKENGVWKIALDEYVKEIEREMLEEMKDDPANSSKGKDADKKASNANKETKN